MGAGVAGKEVLILEAKLLKRSTHCARWEQRDITRMVANRRGCHLGLLELRLSITTLISLFIIIYTMHVLFMPVTCHLIHCLFAIIYPLCLEYRLARESLSPSLSVFIYVHFF